jgi:hypothetical protein
MAKLPRPKAYVCCFGFLGKNFRAPINAPTTEGSEPPSRLRMRPSRDSWPGAAGFFWRGPVSPLACMKQALSTSLPTNCVDYAINV